MKNTSEDILDFWAMIFGNKEYRELGKRNSKWFEKIFNALENDETGFLEFILSCELRLGSIIAKEELIPTTSLLLIKYRNRIKEKRKKVIVDFFNGDDFDNYCKDVFYFIKESISNGNS